MNVHVLEKRVPEEWDGIAADGGAKSDEVNVINENLV